MKPARLVFGFLCCLYALTAGGQGYSVDGTFSYTLSRGLAGGDWRGALSRNWGVLKRWGPVVPVLGVPFVWLGERLAQLAPAGDAVPVGGRSLTLRDWPAIGVSASGAEPVAEELTLSLPRAVESVQRLTVVSFTSFSTQLPDGVAVAELALGGGSRAVLRAGRDTAEWAYDVAGAVRPNHARARVAGHWPGNPEANLYAAILSVSAPAGTTQQLTFRYVAPTGRLHLRAVLVEGVEGGVEAIGPALWPADRQEALFSRLWFSFLNVPLMAGGAALLVPLAVHLGYRQRTAVLLALGFGVTTLAWPYAKHDFSEAAATFFAVASLALIYQTAARWRQRGALASLVAASACACLAAGAKYTAAWFVPLLAVQLAVLLRRRTGWAASLAGMALFLSFPALAAGGAIALRGGPLLWADWRGALSREWLNYSPLAGLYGLLVSPGKSIFLYSPTLLLALAGAWAFVSRHRAAAFVFLAVPAVYLAVFASKGVWHGGGWGPRYLVPAVPFAACLALPAVDWTVGRAGALGRLVVGALVLLGAAVQVLGVAKHPNLYSIMFRDHVAPQLAHYGAYLDGRPALDYWRHFGGPAADRQLDLPPAETGKSMPGRGLGYAYAEQGPLRLRLDARREFTLTLYACDWDHRGRRQLVTVRDRSGARQLVQSQDFSDCEYLSWSVAGQPGSQVTVEVSATGADTPVLSAMFFDPPSTSGGLDGPRVESRLGRPWIGRFGRDGYVLLGWLRGGQDLVRLPDYLAGYSAGERVWLDTGEAELTETALLYAPGFSPILGHAWLLGADAVRLLRPGSNEALQRLLGSPPWRYVHGLEVHPAQPQHGLGLDLWPLLLHAQYSSHRAFMAIVLGAEGVLALGALWFGLGLRSVMAPAGEPALLKGQRSLGG